MGIVAIVGTLAVLGMLAGVIPLQSAELGQNENITTSVEDTQMNEEPAMSESTTSAKDPGVVPAKQNPQR